MVIYEDYIEYFDDLVELNQAIPFIHCYSSVRYAWLHFWFPETHCCFRCFAIEIQVDNKTDSRFVILIK